jgi:hypothetical protein
VLVVDVDVMMMLALAGRQEMVVAGVAAVAWMIRFVLDDHVIQIDSTDDADEMFHPS